MPRHYFVPFGSSEASTSIEESIRPGLRRAYPLPKDQGGDKFQRLLDAIAQRHSHPSPTAGRTNVPVL